MWDAEQRRWQASRPIVALLDNSTNITPRKLTVLRVKEGQTFEEECDILVTARGQLNNISWPDIPGFDTFRGQIMHSSDWNES